MRSSKDLQTFRWVQLVLPYKVARKPCTGTGLSIVENLRVQGCPKTCLTSESAVVLSVDVRKELLLKKHLTIAVMFLQARLAIRQDCVVA